MSDPYIGEIRMFGGNFAPRDWNFCDGSLLSINDFSDLYALIGTTYGGDGQNTFAVPDLRGRLPVHAGLYSGTTYTVGQSAGVETVTLTSNQLPVHGHTFGAATGGTPTSSPSNGVLGAAGGGAKAYTTGSPGVDMGPSLAAQGGNQAHDNIMPFLAVNFIISLFGIFPTQN